MRNHTPLMGRIGVGDGGGGITVATLVPCLRSDFVSARGLDLGSDT